MTSSVRPRPNYYDLLGLSPAATAEEIAKAFAKGMGMFGAHPAGTAAQLSIAFETLRNPAKRRAYDESMGLRREPPKPQQWTMALPRQTTRGFVASAPGPAETAASERLERLAKLAQPQPFAEAVPPPRRPEPPVMPGRASRQPLPNLLPGEDMPLVEWKRPLLTLTGLFVAAGLIGALAGSSIFDSAQTAKASAGPLFGRAVAKGQPQDVVQSPAPASAAAAQPALTPRSVQPRRTPHHPIAAAASKPEETEVASTATDGDAGVDASPAAPDPLAAAADPAPAGVEKAAAATLPLAAKVMARTIERIGYACGSVASATPAEAAGVYKVTCTSGDTYRAAPVHGRYRFRRW